MATDPQADASTAPTWSASPIENELPTYRAISPWAIASLLFGILSIATFASLIFLVASITAILIGAAALRSIRRRADVLTGAGLANLGIALGLITGLAAPTTSFVQRSLIGREALAYSEELTQTLQQESFEVAFWAANPPAVRANTTPEKLMADIESEGRPEMVDSDTRLSSFRVISSLLKSSDDYHLHVDGIEERGFSGTTPYAHVRLLLDGPETDQFPGEQFVLLGLEGSEFEGQRLWYVKEVIFPYEAGSRSQVVESAHGHEH